LARQHVALLIVDVQLPDMDGIALLQRVFETNRAILGVVITGYGNIDMAVRAMKAGASDFLAKPFEMELVRHAVTRLMELYRLRQENTVLKHAIIRTGHVRLTRPPMTDFGMTKQKSHSDAEQEYRRGLAEGEQRAAAQLAAARRQEQTLVAAVVERLEGSWRQLQHQAEEDVASLAFAIAQKVLREAVEERPELVTAQVRAALEHVQEKGLVRVCVHPLDLPLLEAARPALCNGLDATLSIKLEADPAIQRGGCLIHTPSRLIDAQLDQQLLRIGEAIRQRESGETH
jgi:flagellar biosynthesis/type III secretory pathway protein FliH